MSRPTKTRVLRPNWLYIPPPPPWRVGEGPMGSSVLRDLDSELGVRLWLALRAVWTWTAAVPEARARLRGELGPEALARTAAACAEAPELADAIHVLGELTANPGEVTAEQLGRACREVSEWAVANWLHEIAIQFAEAGARANPGEAVQANFAGIACRRMGFGDRATLWYECRWRC